MDQAHPLARAAPAAAGDSPVRRLMKLLARLRCRRHETEQLVPRTPDGRWALDPEPSPEAGLRAALDDLAMAYSAQGLATSVELGTELHLEAATEGLLLRVVQDALRTAAKRAGASRVAITLRQVGDEARLEVSDDGVGFDASALDGGTDAAPADVRRLEDLIHDAGGELRVQSRPAAGTTVQVAVPA